MNDLTGKIAVVTGGNSGIGYATAQYFKASGAKVIITGRDADKVATAAFELGVTGIVADVINLSATDKLVEQVKSEFGNIDILFVNAGIFRSSASGSYF